MSSTVYSVVIHGTTIHSGSSLEAAARTWDHETVGTARVTPGGIEVREYNDEGVMVREGWVLHVNADGVVYLNPSVGREG